VNLPNLPVSTVRALVPLPPRAGEVPGEAGGRGDVAIEHESAVNAVCPQDRRPAADATHYFSKFFLVPETPTLSNA